MSNKFFVSSSVAILYSVFTLSMVLLPARADAQAAQPPATPAPTAPGEPVAPVVTIVGEEYHAELSVGAWFTMPSTVTYSDTEGTVSGTNIDFKKDLGLKDKMFPDVHLTVRLAPRHKLRGEYIPILYKQSATLSADLNFNGQAYLKGQAVDSTLRWNAWHAAYEFDVLTADRGYLGAIAAASSLNISGSTASTTQFGTASVNILMPGLGATARYYPASKVSVTGDVLFFDLPGGATSTHGHILEIDGYATFNFTKHAGVRAGYRSFDTTHVWGSPLNTGSMTIRGPYVGGTAHF
jgi:hypothetical protein